MSMSGCLDLHQALLALSPEICLAACLPITARYGDRMNDAITTGALAKLFDTTPLA